MRVAHDHYMLRKGWRTFTYLMGSISFIYVNKKNINGLLKIFLLNFTLKTFFCAELNENYNEPTEVEWIKLPEKELKYKSILMQNLYYIFGLLI